MVRHKSFLGLSDYCLLISEYCLSISDKPRSDSVVRQNGDLDLVLGDY